MEEKKWLSKCYLFRIVIGGEVWKHSADYKKLLPLTLWLNPLLKNDQRPITEDY